MSGYLGDRMYSCPAIPFNFSATYAVVVSGDGPNFCGHLLLNVGGRTGTYLHVAGIHDFPRQMDENGYQRYLKDAGKTELRRSLVSISNAQAAMLKLEQLLNAKWTWGLLPHNCASFVEEIVRAGGNSAGLYSNCPALEDFN